MLKMDVMDVNGCKQYQNRHNTCSNYVTLERTVHRPRSMTEKQKTYKHHVFAPTASARSTIFPKLLHGDRACRGHRVIHFSIKHSFSYRVHGKIRPN